jgi:hypothetical protein
MSHVALSRVNRGFLALPTLPKASVRMKLVVTVYGQQWLLIRGEYHKYLKSVDSLVCTLVDLI